MSLTEAQARAVRAPAGVAITAGAGTGKTHTLGHRYLWHVERGLSPLQIVAVTFTERAAAELRARVRRYLHAAPDVAGAARARDELEAAQISTLHALAARICREHPDAAGVPPDFGVLGELEGRAWFAEQLGEALADLPPELLARVPFPTARAAMERFLADPVTAEQALSHGPERWHEAIAEGRAEAVEALRSAPAWLALEEGLRAAHGPEGDRLENARREAVAALDALRAGRAVAALERLDGLDLRGGSAKAWGREALGAVREDLKTLRAHAREVQREGLLTLEPNEGDARLAAALPALREAFTSLRGRLDAAKRRARVLDFGDLEAHALRALEDAAVRRHYAARWRALLVDEYQDTNPVQEALLDRLAGEATVTVVGDEKQSIYGFRGADARVFRRTRQRLRALGGQGVELDRSFRTHAPLLHAVDRVARPLFEDGYVPLEAQRAEAPRPGPYLEAHVVEAQREVAKARRQVAEARAIAGRLRALVEGGTLVEGVDGPRPARYGDVAVLARSWAPLDLYAELLPALGVPAMHTGGGDLLATREAQDALSLLRALADADDELAWVAALRSPFFAVDDRTLREARRARGGERPWSALLEDDEADLPEPLRRPRAVLRALWALRQERPPSRLLQEADRLTGYGAVLAHLPGAERRRADWRGVLALVRELESGHEDAFITVRRLRRVQRSGVEAPRPLVQAGDAVTLTTVHRAKGLEWPLVVVADLAAGRAAWGPPVRLDGDVGVALEPRGEGPAETTRPALATLLEARALRAEASEAGRLAYVALTRARDHLILTAADDGGGLWDRLRPGLDAISVTPAPIPCGPEEARWPTREVPSAAPPPEAELWRAPEPTPAARGVGAWAVARAHLAEREPAWLPLLEGLRALGAPPPDRFDLSLGPERGAVAPLAWRAPALALVDAGAGAGASGFTEVPVPFEDPEAVLPEVARVLGVSVAAG